MYFSEHWALKQKPWSQRGQNFDDTRSRKKESLIVEEASLCPQVFQVDQQVAAKSIG